MYFYRLFGAIALLVVSFSAFSQSKLDSVQHINEVMVVAKRYNEIIPAQTLKGKELQQLNSFSVADAIRFFSGVQIKDYGGVGGIKTVNIRSMGTNHMGVFYNGIQLGNAQNGQIDLGKFSIENVEEISLYNGQKSEIFQSAKEFGSAGSIYLTTRRPKAKTQISRQPCEVALLDCLILQYFMNIKSARKSILLSVPSG
jgi:outer membrane cobalamin receptor